MNLLLVLIFTYIFIFPTNSAAQSAEDSQKTNQSTTDKSAQARLYKEQGEKLISQDKTEPAADAFSKALSLDRDTFSPAERVRMAIYLSWADRLQEAEKELNLVLAADPKNRAARTHLARVLGWSGELRSEEHTSELHSFLHDALPISRPNQRPTRSLKRFHSIVIPFLPRNACAWRYIYRGPIGSRKLKKSSIWCSPPIPKTGPHGHIWLAFWVGRES